MFNFLRKPGMRRPSGAILRALAADGLPTGTDVSELGMVESGGRYAGRRVTYFRLFDPRRAAGRSVDVFTRHSYEDLNGHLDLVLRSGFVERDGAVVVFSRTPPPAAPAAARAHADRADHTDYERHVFPDGTPPGISGEARA